MSNQFAVMPPYIVAVANVEGIWSAGSADLPPLTIGSPSTATFPTGGPSRLDTVGGWGGSGAPGGLLVQAPGLVLPVLWNRGSLYNYGVLGDPGVIGSAPPLSSSGYTAGEEWNYWDSPQSWGRENYLVRRPRMLLILNATEDGDSVVSWVNANYATLFAPLNVCVLVGGLYLATEYYLETAPPWYSAGWNSLYAAGFPFSDAPVTLFQGTGASIAEGQTQKVYGTYFGIRARWSLPEIDPTTFTGGDVMVAALMPYILPAETAGGGLAVELTNYVAAVGFFNNSGIPPPPVVTPADFEKPPGWAVYESSGYDETTGGEAYQIYVVNTPKIEHEIAQVLAAVDSLNSFMHKQYQYNVNPTVLENTISWSANPCIPDSVADSLIASGAPTFSRQAFTNGDIDGLLAQLLTDVQTFFG